MCRLVELARTYLWLKKNKKGKKGTNEKKKKKRTLHYIVRSTLKDTVKVKVVQLQRSTVLLVLMRKLSFMSPAENDMACLVQSRGFVSRCS